MEQLYLNCSVFAFIAFSIVSTLYLLQNDSRPISTPGAILSNEAPSSHVMNRTVPPYNIQRNLRSRKRSKGKIIGGIETIKDRYSYVGALITNERHFVCGGVLVAPNWVLTAAHCADKVHSVIFGIHHLFYDRTFQEIEVGEKIVHHNYDKKTSEYDFALLNLKSDTPAGILPITWNREVTVPRHYVMTAMGWGKTEKSAVSIVPREVQLQTMTNEECQDEFKDSDAVITGSMLCAGAHGRDTCKGDSGGPLIKKGFSASEDILYGITSWGKGCADSHPGVYARLSSVVEWMDDVTDGQKDGNDCDHFFCCQYGLFC